MHHSEPGPLTRTPWLNVSHHPSLPVQTSIFYSLAKELHFYFTGSQSLRGCLYPACPTMASEPHLKVRHCRVNTHPSNGLFALRSDRKPTVHWERRAPRGLSPSPLPSCHSTARLQQSRADLRRWRADLSILRVLERVSSCSMRPLLLLIFE